MEPPLLLSILGSSAVALVSLFLAWVIRPKPKPQQPHRPVIITDKVTITQKR